MLFTWLSKKSTHQGLPARGFFPPATIMLTLLGLSGIIAGSSFLWAQLLASSSSFTAFYLKSLLGVSSFTFLNFWFNREINTVALTAYHVNNGTTFGKPGREIDLHYLVRMAHAPLKNHFSKALPLPQICTFKSDHFKIITVEGRNPSKAALFFSSGTFGPHTYLNNNHLVALIQLELAKIYLRREAKGIVLALCEDLLSTLQNIKESSFFFKSLSHLFLPFASSFCYLLRRSIMRSFEYQAGKIVFSCKQGQNLIDALDKAAFPSIVKHATVSQQVAIANRRKAFSYDGPFKSYVDSYIKPIADWIDKQERLDDDKDSPRTIVFFDIIVARIMSYTKELFAEKPRRSHLQNYIKSLMEVEQSNLKMPLNSSEDPPFVSLARALSTSAPELLSFEEAAATTPLRRRMRERSRSTPSNLSMGSLIRNIGTPNTPEPTEMRNIGTPNAPEPTDCDCCRHVEIDLANHFKTRVTPRLRA